MSNLSKHTDQWEGYYLEDCDCAVCVYNQGKRKGCKLDKCCCEEEKLDAIANGRISRKKRGLAR